MKYKSTRSAESYLSTGAVLKGLAGDGGLLVCLRSAFQGFPLEECLKKDTLAAADTILSFLLPDFQDMPGLVRAAYMGKFSSEELTPLVRVGDRYVLELFHGPTSAFKDVALSMLPQLMTSAASTTGSSAKTVILTATSGDTGKAALEGFHDVPGTGIVVFYPADGVSAVQKAQMVCQIGGNVKVCAVRGNFDDCQRGVKTAFRELNEAPVQGVSFSSANSINIGRLIPQITYYFSAYRALLREGRIAFGDKIDYVVPTGNFGDILAGLYAKFLGLPVGELICASNSNDVLFDFLQTGTYTRNRPFYRTVSPSMDILVSSNLERLLYYASGENEEEVVRYMTGLECEGSYTVSGETLANIREHICGERCSEEETLAEIGHVWQKYGYLCDTHTAVAFHAAEKIRSGRPVVVLSTASPFKFPKAVLTAIGGDVSGDDFALMKRLSEISGIPVPANLAGLEGAPVLHTDCIDPENITEYVRRWAEGGKE